MSGSSKLHVYRGTEVEVRFDAGRCIHAAACVHGLPAVFDPKARPWVTPDAAEADALTDVVAQCPTGALTAVRHDGAPCEQPDTPNTATVQPDGPVYLRGTIEVVLGGESETVHRMALCRCGGSANMPHCDGSHGKNGFTDDGSFTRASLPGACEDGDAAPLRITVASGGPAVLAGPVRVHDASGAQIGGSKGALCRCGASANKPFCDGAHKDVASFQGR